jgi:hypothetical protein
MRLSDKNIAALVVAANECDPTGIGYGDVLLLCDEVQTRRADELADVERTGISPPFHEAKAVAEPPTVVLMDMLLERIQNNEAFLDRQVLAFFNGLKRGGYFKTVALVNVDALQQVVRALNGPEYLIRELIATRNLPTTQNGPLNAIDQLCADYEASNADN